MRFANPDMLNLGSVKENNLIFARATFLGFPPTILLKRTERLQVEEKWALTIPELLEAPMGLSGGEKTPRRPRHVVASGVGYRCCRPPASRAHNSGGALNYGL